jgi:Amiloride-sensitive sodium channel
VFFGIRKNLKSLKFSIQFTLFFIGDETTRVCDQYFDKPCYESVTLPEGPCGCLPTCSSIYYSFQHNTEGINYGEGINSTLTIQFAEDEFIVYRRYASFGTVTLLSNIGGLLGLFVGLSALSAVEIFYFFVIKFFNDLWWRVPKLRTIAVHLEA